MTSTATERSILRTSQSIQGSALRSGLKVQFEPPAPLKDVITELLNGISRKGYDTVLQYIEESPLPDSVLIKWLQDLRENVSVLDYRLELLIGSLLNVDWARRDDKVAKAYKKFVLDLVSAHNYYTRAVLRSLFKHFLMVDENRRAELHGFPSLEESQAFDKCHSLLGTILKVVPMSSDLVPPLLNEVFPYMKKNVHQQACYLLNCLRIAEEHPSLQLNILEMIVSRLLKIDVNTTRDEIEAFEEEEQDDEDMEQDNDEEEDIFKMDDDDPRDKTSMADLRDIIRDSLKKVPMKHELAECLDVLMMLVLHHIKRRCVVDSTTTNWECLRTLYKDLTRMFEISILPTCATYHTQFIMFYVCSLKPLLAESFLAFLWKKVTNPNVATILRQMAAAYLGSFLARAKYISLGMLKVSMGQIASWLHSYIAAQDGVDNSVWKDVRAHATFYSVCQTLFYLVAFRHKDLVSSTKNLTFLQSLNLSRLVTCPLNPLRVCIPAVVNNFASITRKYQLAYCYTIMEHNARCNLPIMNLSTSDYTSLESTNIVDSAVGSSILLFDFVFPFDPYLLTRSKHFISPLYREYEGTKEVENVLPVKETREESDEEMCPSEEEDDDFLDNVAVVASGSQMPDFLSYSTSPGFKQF